MCFLEENYKWFKKFLYNDSKNPKIWEHPLHEITDYAFKTRGGYSTLSWVRMCGPKFRTPPYNKTREDANLLPISKPFVSLRALSKTNQCFLQCKLGCISTFWQPVDKPKDKFQQNVQSQGNVYCYYNNVLLILQSILLLKSPDYFATDVLLMIDWSMAIYSLVHTASTKFDVS